MAANHFAALRGKFSTLEMAYEMAHFLRMAFIGASSSGAAFFFMARRRFMAIAFFIPLRMPTKVHLSPTWQGRKMQPNRI